MDNLQSLILEVRDHATMIPVVATLMRSEHVKAYRLLRAAGYGHDPATPRLVMLCRATGGGKAEYDPHSWGDRTMTNAHTYIEMHFDELEHGSVVDVRVILGEEETPAKSEVNYG